MWANVQLLRAVAAFGVVLHHTMPHYQVVGGSSTLASFLTWGFTGVDVFFVISGFVIAQTTLTRPRTAASAATFAWRRAARIYLGYWPFFVAACVVFGLYSPGWVKSKPLLRSFLLLEPDHRSALLPVTWSLTYELFFYALFTLTFALRARHVVLLAHVVLAAAMLRVALLPSLSGPLAFFASPYFAEFFAGVVLYMHRERLRSWWFASLCLVGIVAGYVAGVRYFDGAEPIRVATFGAAAVGVVALAVHLEIRGSFRAAPWLAALGDSSYTLYLGHLMLLQIFFAWGVRNFLARQVPLVCGLGFIAWLALMVGISVVIYRLLEAPLYRAAVRSATREPQRAEAR